MLSVSSVLPLIVAACSLTAVLAATPITMHVERTAPQPHLSTTVRNLLGNNGSHHAYPAGGDVWPVGIYWTRVAVGTPPVEFAVAIDSGSSTLDIEGANCNGCNTAPPNAAYDIKRSSTGKHVAPFVFSNTYETCDLSDMTAPCTISGPTYEDRVSMGSLGPVDVHFGAITKVTSNFDQFKNICGVMGFIGSGPSTVFAQFVAANIVENIWGLCINDSGSKANGTLTLGSVDDRLYKGTVTYVPYPPRSGYYAVPVLGGTVAGSKVAISGLKSEAILDSGTNILLLNDEAFAGVRASFSALCSAGKTLPGFCDSTTKPDSSNTLFDKKCFALTNEQISTFPTVSLAVSRSLSLDLAPHDYLLKGDPRAKGDDSLRCLGIRKTGRGGLFIIGDTIMRNYYLIFDNENQRTGWAPVNKANCGSV